VRRLGYGSNAGGRRWRLVTTLLALVFALAAVAAGCGGDDGGGDTGAATGDTGGGGGEGSIWVLLPDSATSPRWEADDRRFFEQEFTEAGVDFNIVNAEGDAQQQQAQAEQAIADGASVILLISNDTGSGAAIIDIAKDAGVEVVEYDRFNTGGAGGAAYVSFDNVDVGRTMAEVLEPEIDALGVPKPRVVMLNGGEEDNNSFLFRQGYAETVEKRAAAGDWELVADQHVPGWGANGEGQTIMEQILSSANNKVDAVFAANDNLAQQAINALEAAGVEGAPVSGQDASEAGIQNILLGKQTMTVYKPIDAEVAVAAAVALALRGGEGISSVTSVADIDFELIGINTEDGKATDSPEGEGVVPYFALVPIAVTADNVGDTVIADGFRTVEEVCVGDVKQTDFCKAQ
jgi:D-xylose transport system substrate-binding protein